MRGQLTGVADTPLWSLPDADVVELVEQVHAAAAQLAELGRTPDR